MKMMTGLTVPFSVHVLYLTTVNHGHNSSKIARGNEKGQRKLLRKDISLMKLQMTRTGVVKLMVNVEPGDTVLLKNTKRVCKLEPRFELEPFVIKTTEGQVVTFEPKD